MAPNKNTKNILLLLFELVEPSANNARSVPNHFNAFHTNSIAFDIIKRTFDGKSQYHLIVKKTSQLFKFKIQNSRRLFIYEFKL